MRRAVVGTLLALALVGGLFALGIAGAAVTGAAPARSPAPAQAAAARGRTVTRGRTVGKARTWRLRLAPAPDDLALAQIRFPHASRRAVDRDLLRIEMEAPFGSDYLAVAAPRVGVPAAGAQAFVLLVNRPSALEDPVSVRLLLRTPRRLGEHEVRRVENPFAGVPAPAPPDLCDLATRGPALRAGELTPLRSAGPALDGFGTSAAVAQAYDVACGLPYVSAFKQVVTGASAQPQPAPPPPTPAPPQPQPPPQSTPEPPHCASCEPQPGYACPLRARASVCVAEERRLAR
jgi:hypothetical protein